jgi:hypothetical protein
VLTAAKEGDDAIIMRKVIIRLAALTAVAALALTLVSCGGWLSGTYVSTVNVLDSAQFNNEPLVSVELKPFGNAEIVTSGWSVTTYVDGSYKVDGSRITLKAEWDYTGTWEGSYSFSQSEGFIYLDGHEYRKVVMQTPADHDAILRGDFSSVADVYENALGETTTLNKSGQFGDGDSDWMVADIRQNEDGSLAWSIRPVNGGPGGFAVQLYPIGVPVEWDSPIDNVPDDISRIRLHAGHTLPYDGDLLFYRKLSK